MLRCGVGGSLLPLRNVWVPNWKELRRPFQVNAKQLFDLTGRVAIVSGGSMGLGLQMAEGLAEMGANLAICARKQERCEEAAEALRSQGVKTLALGCDVKDKTAIEQVVESTL